MQVQNRVVVKTNLLNGANSSLTVIESKLLNLILSEARETGSGDSPQNPLRITAQMYADTFKTNIKNAYRDLKSIEKTLFNKTIYAIDPTDNLEVKTRWITHIKYVPLGGTLEIVLSHFVLNNILRIDGASTPFTSYQLSNIAMLKSTYSMRLYELIAQYWKMGKVPRQPLSDFKKFMNITEDMPMFETKVFNRRVMKKAIAEIKEQLGIEVEVHTAYVGNSKELIEIKIIKSLEVEVQATIPVEEKDNAPKIAEEAEKIGAYVAPKFPKVQTKKKNKEIHLYAFELSKIKEIQEMAYIGEDNVAFIQRLMTMLKDQKNTDMFMPYLKKLGYNQSC